MSWSWIRVATALVLVGSGLYSFGYRWSPLAAASVMVGRPVHQWGAVRYPWGQVLLLQTATDTRTELVQRHGLLWRDTADSMGGLPKRGPLNTVGWMSARLARGQATVVAVAVRDPAIAFVAAGPPSDRRTRTVTVGKPLILSWNRSLYAYQLNLVALSKTGKPLYHYAMQEHRTTSGGIVSTGLFQWYRVKS